MGFIKNIIYFTGGFACGWIGKENIDTAKVDRMIRDHVHNEDAIKLVYYNIKKQYEKMIVTKGKIDEVYYNSFILFRN